MAKRSVNDSYFQDIDTEEKAYWLGFIAADGCVNDRNGNLRLVIKISTVDEHHLKKLVSALSFDGELYRTPAPPGTKATPTVALHVYSHRLASDLVRHGIVPRKSRTLLPWRGPEDMMRHYWRGAFDGDGSISKRKNGGWCMEMCGSEMMVRGFRSFINVLGIKGGSIPKQRLHGPWYTSFVGCYTPQSVAKSLYVGANVYLERKMERAHELIQVNVIDRGRAVTLGMDVRYIEYLYGKHGRLTAVASELGISYPTLTSYCHKSGISAKVMKSRQSIREGAAIVARSVVT